MRTFNTIIAILFIAAISMLVTAPQARAVPKYYTFEGTASHIDDAPGIIASQMGAGFGVGSFVTYTFIIDFDADGTKTLNDGSTVTLVDSSPNDYFYTDYYSGDALHATGGGYYNNPANSGSMPGWGSNVAENNFGVDSGPTGWGDIDGNSADEFLIIWLDPQPGPKSWVVGTSGLTGSNQLANAQGKLSILDSSLTLTAISATAPGASVPEPSTMLLLGAGLVGFSLFRKRRGDAPTT